MKASLFASYADTMMNTWTVAAAAMLIGAAMGVSSAWIHFDAAAVNAMSLVTADAAGHQPSRARLRLVGKATHDFGVMARGQELFHDFVVENIGTEDLVLTVAGTSCDCTGVEFSKPTVPPGESGDIRVRWEARQTKVHFRQTATIRTSDPLQSILELQVQGRVRQVIRTDKNDFSLRTFSAKSGRAAEINVYNYRDESTEILDFELVDAKNRDRFKLTWQPLSSVQIAAEDGCKSGVVLRVEAKPGRTSGRIDENVRVTSNVTGREVLTFRIRGEATSDIQFTSTHALSTDPSIIDLGVVSKSDGAKAQIFVFTKGEHRHETELSIEEVVPGDVLQVRLAEPRPAGSGSTVLQSVSLVIPPGSKIVNHLGTSQGELGRLVLLTNHPETPRLEFRVRFAIGQ